MPDRDDFDVIPGPAIVDVVVGSTHQASAHLS
jgi:hypothetical protein